MLLRNKIILLFFVLFPSLHYSQIISGTKFSGNSIFGSQELAAWSNAAGLKYSSAVIDTVKYRLSLQLGARGYFFAGVEFTGAVYSEDSASVSLLFAINEGEPAYIKTINFEGGDSLLTEALINSAAYLEGSVFNKQEIESGISDILTHFENTGYPFASVEIGSAYIYSDSIDGMNYADIIIKIIPENLSRIDKVVISGNSSTEDYVILRELRIMPGEMYSRQRIEEFPDKLNRLRFFEPVAEPLYYLNSANEGILQVTVQEKQTNNFDGIIGYIPAADENQKGFVTGLVNISLRNLFGTGRAAAIHWQQINRYSQELELRYLEPWIFGYPFNITGSLFQKKQDTSYVQRNWAADIQYLATESISASVTISTEQVIPTINESSVFTVFNSSSFISGLGLTIDTRDDPYSPLNGILFSTGYSFSRKKIYGPEEYFYPGLETSINLQRISLDFSGFQQIFNRQVVALGLHGRELRGSFFELSDLYRLGGTNSLRGYREEQFAGSRIFWSNLEYRFLLTRRSYALLFFDTGYYLRIEDPDRNITRQEDFLFGYGLGLNIETGLGILGVSFALAQGNSFADGLIHFGIINEF